MTRSLIAAMLITALPSPALAQGAPPYLAPYLMADRDSEIALARSAAPRHVSDSAGVLVLTRTGYVVAAHGTNGFTCLVVRSFEAPITDSTSWDPRVRAPHCLNPQASRTVLKEMILRARLVFSGTAAAQVAERLHRAYSAHTLPVPAPGAMAYMMSKDQWLQPSTPHWRPHLMFYYSRAMHAASWGAKPDFSLPVIDGGSDAREAIQTFLIPVPQWSDGSPVLPPASD